MTQVYDPPSYITVSKQKGAKHALLLHRCWLDAIFSDDLRSLR
jgi:hypothetical protein